MRRLYCWMRVCVWGNSVLVQKADAPLPVASCISTHFTRHRTCIHCPPHHVRGVVQHRAVGLGGEWRLGCEFPCAWFAHAHVPRQTQALLGYTGVSSTGTFGRKNNPMEPVDYRHLIDVMRW